MNMQSFKAQLKMFIRCCWDRDTAKKQLEYSKCLVELMRKNVNPMYL